MEKDKLLNDIKIGLFVGVSVASVAIFFFKLLGVSNFLLILLLYFYPVTGVLVAYFSNRRKEKKIVPVERGYHG